MCQQCAPQTKTTYFREDLVGKMMDETSSSIKNTSYEVWYNLQNRGFEYYKNTSLGQDLLYHIACGVNQLWPFV